MTLSELLPELHALARADKLRVIQVLAADVAGEEDIEVLKSGTAYPIWSPYDAFDAAAVLSRVLDEERAAQ